MDYLHDLMFSWSHKLKHLHCFAMNVLKQNKLRLKQYGGVRTVAKLFDSM